MKKPFGRIGLATAGGVLALGLMAAPRVAAQGRLPNEVRSSIGGAFNLWRFAHPVAQDSLSVSRVSQIAIPVSAAVSAGRWTFDAGFAYVYMPQRDVTNSKIRAVSTNNGTVYQPSDPNVIVGNGIYKSNMTTVSLGMTFNFDEFGTKAPPESSSAQLVQTPGASSAN